LLQQLEEANRKLVALQAQNEKLRRDAADVIRLRGEVGQLRENTSRSNNDPAASAAKSWLARVSQLKERLQQTPGARIPELQYLTEQDWLNTAKEDLNTDKDYRRALSDLRGAAEGEFMTLELKPALNQYAQANNGQFPTDLSQLQPYFNPPVDASVLQRWEVVPQSAVPSLGEGATLITQIAPVDADYDSRYAIGPNGYGSTKNTQVWDPSSANPDVVLAPVLKAYMAANNGVQPTDPSQLTPYVTTPEQQATLQKVLNQK